MMASFASWMPIRVWMTDAGPQVFWFNFDGIRSDEAYFSDTVKRAASRPFNLAFGRTTSLEEAVAIAHERATLHTAGFIFHLSRCGSTLVSKSLALHREARVIAEAGPINDVLNLPCASEELRVTWLRAIIALLARAERPEQRRAIVKCDAWHARSLGFFRRAFPDAPWIFIHREPIEVLVSHLQAMSYMMSAANASAALGISVTEAMRVPREEYCARVLAEILASVRRENPEPWQCVDYRTLPAAAWESVASAFGLALSEQDVERMRESARFHAKRPHLPFSSDTDEKRASATPAAADAVRRWLDEPYSWFKQPLITTTPNGSGHTWMSTSA